MELIPVYLVIHDERTGCNQDYTLIVLIDLVPSDIGLASINHEDALTSPTMDSIFYNRCILALPAPKSYVALDIIIDIIQLDMC